MTEILSEYKLDTVENKRVPGRSTQMRAVPAAACGADVSRLRTAVCRGESGEGRVPRE